MPEYFRGLPQTLGNIWTRQENRRRFDIQEQRAQQRLGFERERLTRQDELAQQNRDISQFQKELDFATKVVQGTTDGTPDNLKGRKAVAEILLKGNERFGFNFPVDIVESLGKEAKKPELVGEVDESGVTRLVRKKAGVVIERKKKKEPKPKKKITLFNKITKRAQPYTKEQADKLMLEAPTVYESVESRRLAAQQKKAATGKGQKRLRELDVIAKQVNVDLSKDITPEEAKRVMDEVIKISKKRGSNLFIELLKGSYNAQRTLEQPLSDAEKKRMEELKSKRGQ